LDLSGRHGFRQRVGNAGEEQPHKGVEGRVQGLIGAMQLPDIPGKPVERRGNSLFGRRDSGFL